MGSFRSIRWLTFATFTVVNMSQALAHEEEVILVGRNGAGEIRVHLDFEQPVELPPSIFSGIPGFATGELAFHSTILDEPTNDFFQLSTEADFRLVLLTKDPGVELWTGTSYMATNDTYFIGPSPFDNHPIWNITNGTSGNSYSLTLRLIDLNGVYPDSDPFILSFTPPSSFEINITQVDSQHVMLSWSTNAIDWELQAVASITTTNWSVITNAPDVAGTNFSLSITTVDTQQFFRLRKQ